MSESGLLEVNNQIGRILTPTEEEKLLSSSPPHLRSIIITALNTGMRKGEILSLIWKDVDLENNLIKVSYLVSKSKKTRRIPVNARLRRLLLEQKLISGGSEYVFLSSNGSPYKRHDSLNQAFEGACRRSGIRGLRFHDLDTQLQPACVEGGANIVAVSRILGHADLRTTMRYAHPDDSLKDAVEKLENFNTTCSNFRSSEEIK